MKRPFVFIILAVVCGCIAFFYMGMSVRSVDYHDGEYHPIPRERYIATFLISLVGTVCFWRLGRRLSRASPVGRDE